MRALQANRAYGGRSHDVWKRCDGSNTSSPKLKSFLSFAHMLSVVPRLVLPLYRTRSPLPRSFSASTPGGRAPPRCQSPVHLSTGLASRKIDLALPVRAVRRLIRGAGSIGTVPQNCMGETVGPERRQLEVSGGGKTQIARGRGSDGDQNKKETGQRRRSVLRWQWVLPAVAPRQDRRRSGSRSMLDPQQFVWQHERSMGALVETLV